jgi:hydroxyacylglutathione hydrolase
MEYRRFILGVLASNCYVVWSNQAAGVIDPGGSVDQVIQFIAASGLKPEWILNTHGHCDHIAGNAALQKRYAVPLLIHAADQAMLLSPTANLSAFMGEPVISPAATRTLADGETVWLGETSLRVIATPGHTRGGISLYTPDLLFAGDALFKEGIGRTDFPGGDYRQLVTGIRERLFCLPPATVVLPGHGEATTIGHELACNPYLGEADEV